MSGYATVQESLVWFSEETGQKPRQEQLTNLNDARRFFYSVHQRLRLDFYIEACFCVKQFCQSCFTCGTGENLVYDGISLPNEMEQIEAGWVNDRPIPMYDKWFEYKHGIKMSGSSSLKFIDMGGDFPLEQDWGCNRCAKLKFIALEEKDCNKVVTVRYVAPGGEDRIEQVKLSTGGSCIEGIAEKIHRPGGIVLPTGLEGGVIVQEAKTGQLLARLHPRITVPSFRRVKLTGACDGGQIYIRATRKYTDLYFDWEVVETDNKLALLDAHRYLKAVGVASTDPGWMQKAALHNKNVENYLAGANQRSDGGGTVRSINILPAENRRSGLRSRRVLKPWGQKGKWL